MKRMLSLVLVACLCMTLCVPGMASTITEGNAQSAETTVKYGMETKYTVMVPDRVVIGDDGMGYSLLEVDTANTILPVHTMLNITIDGPSYDYDTMLWYLTNQQVPSEKLAYSITSISYPKPMAPGDVLISYNGTDEEASLDLEFGVALNRTIAGQYTDLLTFSVFLATFEMP